MTWDTFPASVEPSTCGMGSSGVYFIPVSRKSGVSQQLTPFINGKMVNIFIGGGKGEVRVSAQGMQLQRHEKRRSYHSVRT